MFKNNFFNKKNKTKTKISIIYNDGVAETIHEEVVATIDDYNKKIVKKGRDFFEDFRKKELEIYRKLIFKFRTNNITNKEQQELTDCIVSIVILNHVLDGERIPLVTNEFADQLPTSVC